MKFVALLSGGKDSCFNVIKSIQYGHDLVCLANLAPPESFCGEDMDSFMYQTAGHSAVSHMHECFGVPLIRRCIMGTAVSQKLDYLSEVKHDEVEDMFLLLKDVKERHPEVEGVSCGAIVSTYQRFRVESICQRLGLTVLSYLWQRDRVSLLQEMIAAGVNAVLVKVAGAGLEPHKHLGKSLAALQPTLMRLHEKFGLDVCGEGGEYESLVLDCSVFTKRLVLHDTDVVIDAENYTVGYLKIGSCSVVAKDGKESAAGSGAEMVTAFANPDNELLAALEDTLCSANSSGDNANLSTFTDAVLVPDSSVMAAPVSNSANRKHTHSTTARSLPRVMMGSDSYGQSSLVYPLVSTQGNAGKSGTTSTAEQVQAQLADMMTRLQAALAQIGVSLSDILFVHLYIESSGVFNAVNDEYCKWFGHYPPSRSCVCVPLPEGVRVCMEMTFLKGSHRELLNPAHSSIQRRQVLHVKSMSEWAPLCIGPYSQANTVHRSLIFVAGQIPLNPATMKLFDPSACATLLSSDLHRALRDALQPATQEGRNLHCTADADSSALSDSYEDKVDPLGTSGMNGVPTALLASFLVQVTLCLRHAHRVLQATNSSLSRTLCCTVYVNLPILLALRGVAGSNPTEGGLASLISEDQLVLFVRRMVAAMEMADGESRDATGGSSGQEEGDDFTDDCAEDTQDACAEKRPTPLCPVLIVCTSGLPRDALVEVEVVGFVNNTIPPSAFMSSQSAATVVPVADSVSAAADCAAMSAQLGDSVKKNCASLTAQVDAWPIWSAPQLSLVAVQDEDLLGATATARPLHYRAQVMHTSLNRNLCVGFIAVSAHKEANSSVTQGTELQVLHHASKESNHSETAAENIFVNVDDTVELLVQEVSAAMRRAHLHSNYLRTLKVYYAQDSFVTEDLASVLSAQLGVTMGMKALPVLLVPMHSLEMYATKGRKVVLAAQMAAFDLAQLDTEEWVHVKE